MKTRFDETTIWVTGMGCVTEIANMETDHLMNTVRMFVLKPNRTVGMIVSDIERSAVCLASNAPWTPDTVRVRDVKKESISNITSMDTKELVEYALNSPLGKAMLMELSGRGVNISNFLDLALAEANGSTERREGR